MTAFRPLHRFDARIEQVELFRLDVRVARHFSFGTRNTRQHVIVRLGCGDCDGWGEGVGGWDAHELDIAADDWLGRLGRLKGMTIADAADLLKTRHGEWWANRLEPAEQALIDLAGKLSDQSAMEILGLEGRQPVPGLFCILEEDPAEVRKRAQISLEQNLRTHCKLKIFGQVEKDAAVVRAAREVFGPDAFLTADANSGYKLGDGYTLDDLAADLRTLHAAGLSAAEDPATMDFADWVRLQEKVEPLGLIPDYPTRPASDAPARLLAGMGHFYNLHPDTMRSLIDTVALGRHVKETLKAGLMIGDNSLIGPACAAWQHLAIGLGAAWVEAIEKPQESQDFLNCVRQRATGQIADGRFAILQPRPGFGLEVDAAALRGAATSTSTATA